MGSGIPKQFLTIGGLPILVHSLRVLEAAASVAEVILAVSAGDREYCLREIVTPHGFTKVKKVVTGGEHRQDSVRHGLESITDDTDVVLVHDAVRPFLTVDMVEQVIARAAQYGAAVVAIPMRDTVKQAGADGLIASTVDRNGLWLAQTPQAFRLALLREAHQKALLEAVHATDDAQLVERLGHRVALVEGNGQNIKITRPEDLALGEAILAARSRRES